LDYEACLAYLLLPPAGGVLLLVLEQKSDYVRYGYTIIWRYIGRIWMVVLMGYGAGSMHGSLHYYSQLSSSYISSSPGQRFCHGRSLRVIWC